MTEPMKLTYIREHCSDCGDCDHHYRGIREVARIYDGLTIPANEWGNIQRAAEPAVDACKAGALILEVA